MKIFRKITFFRLTQVILTIFALVALWLFAQWWFKPEHIPFNFQDDKHLIDIAIFASVSFVIWHPLLMEVLNWIIALHIKDRKKQTPASGLRVAFITTIVPSSESTDLLHQCLPAMTDADYPHDTWVLDEGNSDEVQAICEEYGVKHFSRYRRRLYNNIKGKFVRKTKGGNHNSWYDTHGDNYDIVAQIDTDFIPRKSFLTDTLGYFRDPKVAFVGTPQVYGNIHSSIIARGAEEQQYSFYGIILRGLSSMGMTLLIGANHVIRVAALKEVNHYSAHITEDLLTGMKLHAKGWKSVYVSKALAIGEGPSTWRSYFNQQMRWAYGCMDILFHHSFRFYLRMGLRRTFFYFFLQQHYFSGIVMAVSTILLSFYFIFGIRAASVDSRTFSLYYFSIFLMCWLMSIWFQRFYIHRKTDPDLLIAGKIISMAAWPIWFLAFISVIFRKRIQYKVTPKGSNEGENENSLPVFLPHFIFGSIAVLCLWYSATHQRNDMVMIMWASITAFMMILMPFIHRAAPRLRNIDIRFQKTFQSFFTPSHEFSFSIPYMGVGHARVYSSLGTRNNTINAITSFLKNSFTQDIVFISGIVIASALLYIGKVGFYSDDWSFLGNFLVSLDRSLFGLIHTATTPNTFMRPVQNIFDAVLFYFFGIEPLGYQIVNTSIFLFLILLLYLILRQLRLPRFVAVSVPLVFAMLPHYATDRFWYAAFQVNLSMLFYLISLYSGIRAFLVRKSSTFWKVLSLFSLVISGLSYETQLPLIFLNVFIYFVFRPVFHLKDSNRKEKRNPAVFMFLTLVTLAYLFVFKALTTTRLGEIDIPGDIIRIITSAVKVSYGTLGVLQPFSLMTIVTKYSNPIIFISAALIFFAVFFYIQALLAHHSITSPRASWMRNFTGVGFVIFLLGYTVFFTNNNIGFSSTGIDNRVNIAAALGVAITFIGCIGWVSKKIFRKKMGNIFMSLAIASICASGFIIINTIAFFWVEAYQQAKEVINAIQEEFPTIHPRTALIIDGVCPYVGPGVVFEAHWDLKGALHSVYGDPTLRADIVTPRMKLWREGITTYTYDMTEFYPYRNITVFNYMKRKSYEIRSEKAARGYFKDNPQINCPPGRPGHGTDIF